MHFIKEISSTLPVSQGSNTRTTGTGIRGLTRAGNLRTLSEGRVDEAVEGFWFLNIPIELNINGHESTKSTPSDDPR